MKLHSHSQQLFLIFFRPGKQLQELLPGHILNNCSCLPPRQPGHGDLPGAACRTIVLSLPPWPGSPIPRTILRIFPGSQAPNPEPEQKKARSRRCEPLSRTIYPRTGDSPNKSPTISHPAGCFLGVIRLFRYLLLYQPHHLMLALRSSSFALPFSETPQAFQALAPYSSR